MMKYPSPSTSGISIHFGKRLALAMASGVVYSMAYPPIGWRWLVVPGIIGLLVALRGLRGTRARAIGFIHGMIAYGIGVSWLYEIFGGLVVMLWCVLAAFTALFAEMQSRAVARGVGGWQFAVFTALNWSAWEFIRAELFPLKFPWMTAGLAIGPNTLLPWIGVYGVSLLMVFAVGLLAVRKCKSAAAVLIVLATCVYLNKRVPAPEESDPRTVTVGGLQLEGVSMTHYLDGTRKMPDGVELVVWPEYSVPFDIRTSKRDWKLVQDLCAEHGITLTFGTKAGPAPDDSWRNIALTVDGSGALGEHTKVHPVHFFDDGTPGKTALPVLTKHGKIGTPICFDCDYEGVVRDMTAAGAELIVAPTMDAETWTARQHDQHAELFRIRAGENGRWFFGVATSGVSQIIDPNGHLHARLDALRQGPITGLMKRENVLTFYTRFGWLTPWCVLCVAAVGWLVLVGKKASVRRNEE
jgi:apolipoprotein N-acyltransferase